LSRDWDFGVFEVKALEALLPNAQLRVLEDGDQMLQEDRPDLISGWIVDFLKKL
jgi:hypothetical protein